MMVPVCDTETEVGELSDVALLCEDATGDVVAAVFVFLYTGC